MLSDQLRAFPIFSNLTEGQREQVAERLEETDVDLGTVLARQGDFAYHFFVVRAGVAAVTLDQEWLAYLGPGSSFGEIGVLERGRRSANVVAASRMSLLTLAVWDFNELAGQLPEFAAQARAVAQERVASA